MGFEIRAPIANGERWSRAADAEQARHDARGKRYRRPTSARTPACSANDVLAVEQDRRDFRTMM